MATDATWSVHCLLQGAYDSSFEIIFDNQGFVRVRRGTYHSHNWQERPRTHEDAQKILELLTALATGAIATDREPNQTPICTLNIQHAEHQQRYALNPDGQPLLQAFLTHCQQ